MNIQILSKRSLIVLAIIVSLCGCTATNSNLNSDLNNYTVPLYLAEYTPKIDATKYPQFSGKKMCLSNIRNDAGNTTNFGYFSKDKRVRYELSNRANTIIMLAQNYFWYAYQKAFFTVSLEASTDCSPENTPELWIIFQSFNDEELQMKITVLKNRETLYEKDLAVAMPPAESRNVPGLQKRAYEMTDLAVSAILNDPGFQAMLLK
jgi:hypothetical protein